jgi:NAD(P)H-dependent flavin oxidoreductase YrpB (nitropropane dioxygenase family)
VATIAIQPAIRNGSIMPVSQLRRWDSYCINWEISVQELLKIRYPIIQAPMAGTDNPEFIAAACNAGVLGSLGAQYRTPEEITRAIADIRKLTNKPFAVNLFTLNEIAA